MKTKFKFIVIFFIIVLLYINPLKSQSEKGYYQLLIKGDSFKLYKNYSEAMIYYRKALNIR